MAGLTAAIVTPAVGFFVGTPFALVRLPQFLDGMTFEIRHYGILGHGFATIEPGWPHATAFLGWMRNFAAGQLVTLLGSVGAALLVLWRWRVGLLVLFFPICFLLLMVSQRVTFFRNMLVMIPFFCILATWSAERATRWLAGLPWASGRAGMALATVLVLMISAQPLAQAVRGRHELSTVPAESRVLVSQWLEETSPLVSDVAIAAELHLLPADYAARGVTRVSTSDLDPVSLFLAGFGRIVVGPEFDPGRMRGLMPTERVFPGQREPQGIPINPEVTIYRLPDALANADQIRSAVESEPRYSVRPPTFAAESAIPVLDRFDRDWGCAPKDADDESATLRREDCLVPSRIARIVLNRETVATALARGGDVVVTLELRTAWPSQSCTLELPGWTSPDLCAGLEPGRWERRSATVPAEVLAGQNALSIMVGEVHSPSSQSGSRDERILGLWVRAVALDRSS